MVRPSIVPFRWLNHGQDIRVFVDEDRTLFHAGDICKALERFVEVGEPDWVTGFRPKTYPLPTERVDEACEKNGEPIDFFTVDQVVELALDVPMVALQGDFLDWLEETIAYLSGEERTAFIADSNPEEPGLKEAKHYDVAEAARILSHDPALSFTRALLFAALDSRVGWIRREDVWVPQDEPVKAGYLVRRTRHIPGRQMHYPQILITHSGLLELHRLLGGTPGLELIPHPALTLLELP